MKTTNKLSFSDFFNLGKEQSEIARNKIKKIFVSTFGILEINPRIRSGRIITEIMKLEFPDNACVLDAGFGYGITLFYLAKKFQNWHFIGYDLNNSFIKNGKKIKQVSQIKNVIIKRKNLENVNDYHKFDLIYSSDVLEHIPDDVRVLKNLKQALKPTGWLLLHLPLEYERSRRIFPWFKNYDTEDHVRDEYTPGDITQKLTTAGYNLVSLKFGYSLLKGELAFELNNFIKKNRYLLILSQMFTFPIALVLGFFDITTYNKKGNSLIILAKPVD